MGAAPWLRGLGIAAGLAILAVFLYLTREALPPFLIAFGIATVLDPLLDRLQQRGWSRRAASGVVFAAFLLVFFGVALILLPMAVHQAAELVGNVPGYYTRFTDWGQELLNRHLDLLRRLRLPTSSAGMLTQYQQQILAFLRTLVSRLVAVLGDSLGKLVWLAIIPIVTFYLMQDIDRIVRRLLFLFPDRHRDRIADVGRDVVAVFTGYLRGLCIVCSLYAVVNILSLALAFRLPYALVIGLFSGILYAVPYIGAVVTVALGALVALATDHATTAYVVGVALWLLFVNQVFDQLITPRVVGGLVGLHPVISIFALTVGGNLFGLVGMILAVPIAASIQVILVELFPALTRPLPGDSTPTPRRKEAPQADRATDRAAAASATLVAPPTLPSRERGGAAPRPSGQGKGRGGKAPRSGKR
jgi:predicted PurR-regulated permease PerM